MKLFLILLSILTGFTTYANPIENKADSEISTLYHKSNFKQNSPITDRIVWFSEQFLNRPYLLGPLGEGDAGRFDQFPLYRTDAFDCMTYVETVLALALSSNLKQFEETLLKIRYENGHKEYIYRNHFTDLDWNTNNQKQGFIQDITLKIHDKNQKSVASFAKAVINKPDWYKKATLNAIRIQDLDKKNIRLAELNEAGKIFKPLTAKIPYLSFEVLFNKDNQPNMYLFNQIPQAAIIEIIRPNWDLTKQIGTHLNVSHLGFAIWQGNVLYFREASSKTHTVIDTPLIDYLLDAKKSPTIKGINVQRALVSLGDKTH